MLSAWVSHWVVLDEWLEKRDEPFDSVGDAGAVSGVVVTGVGLDNSPILTNFWSK